MPYSHDACLWPLVRSTRVLYKFSGCGRKYDAGGNIQLSVRSHKCKGPHWNVYKLSIGCCLQVLEHTTTTAQILPELEALSGSQHQEVSEMASRSHKLLVCLPKLIKPASPVQNLRPGQEQQTLSESWFVSVMNHLPMHQICFKPWVFLKWCPVWKKCKKALTHVWHLNRRELVFRVFAFAGRAVVKVRRGQHMWCKWP